MNWIIYLLCAAPFWGAILLYWLTNWLQKRRYVAVAHSDNFVFFKAKNGDLTRQGQSARNWLALFFLVSLELVLLGMLYQNLQSDPVMWTIVCVVSPFAVFSAWLIFYFFQLQLVPPIHFDAQSQEIRFEEGRVTHTIPFSDVQEIAVKYAGPQSEDEEKANRSTFTLSLPIISSGKTLEVARLTGRSVKKNTLRQEALVELLNSVIQVTENQPAPRQTPLQAPVGQMLSPMETLIAQNLRKIQKEGGEGNFVIFTANPAANYFIQVAGAKGDDRVYAEAASNQVIAADAQLSAEQTELLQVLGWKSPADEAVNYHRTWQVSTHDARLMAAQAIMRTFVEVYALDAAHALAVDLNLA